MTKTEKPKITPELRAAAKKQPGGWVYQMDWEYPEWRHVMPNEIIGAWEVDDKGELTGEFESNAKYRPFRKAKREPREHMKKAVGPDYVDEWVRECDPAYDHMFPDFPPEAIIGSWLVGPDGKYTGHFRPNPDYTGDIKT